MTRIADRDKRHANVYLRLQNMKNHLSIQKYVAAIALAVLLNGCVSYNRPDFGGYRDVNIVPEMKTEAAIEKNYTAHSSEAQIMGQFTFNLRIIDPTQDYASATITTIEALYKDGNRSRLDKPWTTNLNEVRKSLGGNSPIYVNVKSLFFRHSNVIVTYSGYLTTQDGKMISFSGKEKFRAGRARGTICLLLHPGALT
jgi:hypothetical protein